MIRFTSLAQFYNSEIWRSFRLQLMNERAINGVIYDEWNGLPIYKAFDVVAHHKIELTLQNVNDVSISLNPDNIMLVSHRSHNEIHARYGFMANKKIYYVYGAPCAGKSSFVQTVKGNSDFIIDIDLIWLQILSCHCRRKKLPNNVFLRPYLCTNPLLSGYNDLTDHRVYRCKPCFQ